MTVKELKQALRGIPDETPVIGLTGGGDSSYVGVSSARLDEYLNEDDKEVKQLVIYLTNYID
jgi:hypothetical protein